jgi:hypothetical protein
MTQKLIVHAPINQLSLGQFSFNILRELYNKKVQVVLFPYGTPDLTSYRIDQQFGNWIERSVNSRYEKLDRNTPSLALWHINGSESKFSDKQYLYTFHETDSPTPEEINIVNQQEFTFFSSEWSVENFKTYGASNVGFVPLGLDSDFRELEGRQISDEITHWVLAGTKFEQRKNTELIIRSWLKKYINNPKHHLTLMVNNPFYKPEQMNQVYSAVLGGSKPFNVNILPPVKTNNEMNHLYNSVDIDLSGLSGAEGWNIPAHTCTALGKWSIVLDHTGHRGWATKENSILVEPTGMRPVYDNVFFHKGTPFNQGNIYNVSEERIFDAFALAEQKAKTPNIEGKKLREKHTYSNTVEKILEKIF